MNNTTKYVLIGVGVLALLGISVFAIASTKKLPPPPIEPNLPPPPPPPATITDVADKVISSIKGNSENAAQRIANRSENVQARISNKKLRQATKQAKLLKRGKIKLEDLQALQQI